MKRTTISSLLFSAFALAMFAGCMNGVFYQPNRRVYRSKVLEHDSCEAVQFQSRDGTQLSGCFIRARGKAKGTIVHFHGNAQNMTAHSAFIDWAPERGWNVFMFDYRGYGRSGGYPSRGGVYDDCVAALAYVFKRSDINPEHVVVFGQSLGGANAVPVVAGNPQFPVKGLVVDSAFASYRGISFHHLSRSVWLWPVIPFLPVLISGSYDPEDYVADLSPTPVLFIHCEGDRVIPASHSRRLYRLARPPKDLLILPGGRHVGGVHQFPQHVIPRIDAFFTGCIARKHQRDM